MKKILSLLALVLMSCMGAWAQAITHGNAGTPMTYADFVALSGTGKHFGLMAVSDNGATYKKWFGFTAATSRVDELTTAQLFTLTGETNDYTLTRFSTNTAAVSGIKVVNRAGSDYASEYTAAMQISFDDASNLHFNANSYAHAGGAGGWSAYVAYGPFYVAQVEYQLEGTTVATVNLIVKEGENTITTAPAGYDLVGTPSINVTEDATFQVEVTEGTLSFPAEGTYYMTFTNADSGQQPYIYNSVNDRQYTLQSATRPSPLTNGYVWKVVTDGTNITSMTDGTGQNIGVNGNFKGRLTSTLNLRKLDNGRYYITSSQITGGHECINRSSGGYTNNGIRTVTTWTDDSKTDNQWIIEDANFEGEIYNVEVTGGDGYAIFNGQQALNGGFFFANSIIAADVTASEIHGYGYTVTIEDNTIKVAYTLEATPATVTYNYVIDGETFATENIDAFVGDPFPEPTKSFVGYALTGKPAGNVETTTGAHNITLSEFSGPFEPTTLGSEGIAADTKWYYMQNGNYGYAVYLNDESKKSGYNANVGVTDVYRWAFVRKTGTPYFYLYNKAAGAVAMRELRREENADWFAKHNQSYVVADEEATDMPLLLKPNKTGYTLQLADAEGTCILGKHVGSNLSVWGNGATLTDDGSRFNFSEVPTGIDYSVKVLGANLSVTIKGSNYTDGATIENVEDELSTTDVVLASDENYVGSVTINGTNIVVTYHHKGAAIDFTGKKVEVGEKATAIVPDTKWYVLTQIRGGETPAYITTDNKVYRAAASNTVDALFPGKAAELATYLVRFVSTNVEGVYEIQHGNGMYWSTPGANNTKLSASNNAADAKFYFVYGATQTTSGADANGWAMNYTTDFTTKADKVDNDAAGSTVGYWGNGNTESGTNNIWYIYETTFSDLPTYDWEEFAVLLNNIKSYTIGDGLGEYADIEVGTSGDDARISELMSSFESDLEEANEDHYNADMDDMQWILEHMQLNMPKIGQFFRIKASTSWIQTPTYMKGTEGAHNSRTVVEFTQDTDEIAGNNTIFCYFHTNGDYLACYGNGMTAANNSNFMGMKRYPSTTAIAFQAATTGEKIGKYNIKFAGSRFLYTNKGLYGDAGAGNTAEGYNFTLEEVTSLPVSISAAKYATLYAPVALTIPENVTAYTLTVEGDYLKAAAVETTIPANTGVVLAAEEAGTYNFAITTSEAFDGENELTGTVPTIAKVDNALVLGMKDDQIGFYGVKDDVLAGFKAYYVPAAGESNLRIVFDNEVLTSIITAAQENGGQAIYDLQGRRVVKAQNGLNIINGKKVIK